MSTLLELIDRYGGLCTQGDVGDFSGQRRAERDALRAEIERQLSTMVDVAGEQPFSTWYQITAGPSDAEWMGTGDVKEALDEHHAMSTPHKLWRRGRYLVWGPWERWTEGEAL